MAERYSLLPVVTGNPYPQNTARHAAYEAGRASLAANVIPEGITRDDTVHGETYFTAATLAVHAMTEAIHKANQLTVSSPKPWTKKQQAAIAQANSILEAAGIWSGRGWTTAQAYDVVQAGIDAVTQWANQPKDTK